jgi:16S rRNA (uracil1498-N3)-methyltransferase
MNAFELALEKAVEVGVTRIIPFTAARSNATAGDRMERWRRIVVEAAKQSKRFRLPVLDAPLAFGQVLHLPAASKILLAERDGGHLKAALSGSPVLFLIGPEGGWTDDELAQSDRAGFKRVSLGAGILRSETAALVGAALIRYELEGR